MSTPAGVHAPQAPASTNATVALVMGILSFLCCQLLGPVAWYMGNKERQAIRQGLSSPSGDGLAMAGMVLGIITTALLVLGILGTIVWMIFAGGIAALGALGGH